jgi:membrane-bound ClpP family serine protease
MTLGAIIGLLIVGLLLVLIEIFIVPGIIKVGVFGLILIAIGVILGFYYDEKVGWYSLFGAIFVGIVLTIVALQAKTWEKFALNTTIDSTVEHKVDLELGQKGVAISRLSPIGKVKFENGTIYEVKTQGEMIDEHTKVEFTKLDGHAIIVKALA